MKTKLSQPVTNYEIFLSPTLIRPSVLSVGKYGSPKVENGDPGKH